MSLRDVASQSEKKPRRGQGTKGRILTVKEIKRIRRRGYQAERQLVSKLRALGFRSVRVPVSAPSSEPLPDVFATKGGWLLAFEVKSPSADRSYFPGNQVKKLFDFLEMFEAYDKRLAVLAGKFRYRWVFKQVTEIGDYAVSRDEKSNIRLNEI